eukprot:PLAT5753.1.p1 GENE.PLAT5753.1~~PLAT5753.1.p1  ORF type:complete len:374 (-),score=167.64 PLAT5753.1:27-1148(-)
MMNVPARLLLFAALLLAAVAPAAAWRGALQQAVVEAAFATMRLQSQHAVQAQLRGQPLAAAATASHAFANSSEGAWSRPFHQLLLADGQKTVQPGCPAGQPDCLLSALANYTGTLSSFFHPPIHNGRRVLPPHAFQLLPQAVRMLLALVGDAHTPTSVGRLSTDGGASFPLFFNASSAPGGVNLTMAQLWQQELPLLLQAGLPASINVSSPASLRAALRAEMRAVNRSAALAGMDDFDIPSTRAKIVAAWASDAAAVVADGVYAFTPAEQRCASAASSVCIGDAYARRLAPSAFHLMALSAVRLAACMNALVDNPQLPSGSPNGGFIAVWVMLGVFAAALIAWFLVIRPKILKAEAEAKKSSIASPSTAYSTF